MKSLPSRDKHQWTLTLLARVVATTPDLVLDLPANVPLGLGAGRFFLARAEAGESHDRAWETFLRRALFPVAVGAHQQMQRVAFHIPSGADAGYAWLATRQAGDVIDLLGPYGNGFSLAQQSRTLLLASYGDSATLLLPLATAMLDRGGRVTLLLRVDDEYPPGPLLARLPIAVEVRPEAGASFGDALVEVGRWADQIALCLPTGDYSEVAHRLRAHRFRLSDGYAQALVRTPLPCGCGACLACLVTLAHGGFTRACIHGPVFDLNRLG